MSQESAVPVAANLPPGGPSIFATVGHFFYERRWSWGSVFTGLAMWEFVSRVIIGSKLFLAAPTQVLYALFDLARSGELEKHIWVSTIEFLIGYISACFLGVALGFLMASFTSAKQALQPWVSGLYATPTVALAPLFILWFGIGIFSKVVVVAVLVIFPVTINTETGLRTTSQHLIETVRSFGATRSQIFFKVSLPSALPFIFAGFRLGIGRGLIGVVVGELFGARAGLGQLISQSSETFNMPDLFAGVTLLAVAGIVLTNGFYRLEKKLIPWGNN
jgi:NitT/TauT family transport system permease protein